MIALGVPLLLGASLGSGQVAAPWQIIDRAPPGFCDREGWRPAAGVAVFRDRGSLVGTSVSGLLSVERDGWLAVVPGSPAAQDVRVRSAIAGSGYAAHAHLDRIGGLCWPQPAALVRLRSRDPGLAPACLRDLFGNCTSVHAFAAVPGLFLVGLDVHDGDAVMEAVGRAAVDPRVEFCEPDMAFTGSSLGEWVPADPGFPNCWGHLNAGQSSGWLPGFDMRSTHAWSISLGAAWSRVLVIDVGVDPDHPDVAQLPGRDFTTGEPGGIAGGGPVNSCDRHGTPVASCVSSIANNRIGTVGAAPGCRSVSARCFVSSTSCSGSWSADYSWTALALDWAAQEGIRVSNNSNRYGLSSAAVSAAYEATRASGMVHFASAGNSGNSAIVYPASLPTVNAIGALAPGGTRASFSCFGPKIFVAAPGSSIYAADNRGASGYSAGDYAWMQGTSFASPYVAGVAALVLSVAPSLDPAGVEAAIRSSARDLGSAGFDDQHGWGIPQADGALLAAVPCPGDVDDDLRVDGSDLGALLGDWGSDEPRSDLDGNGSVDGDDLGTLLASWGPCI